MHKFAILFVLFASLAATSAHATLIDRGGGLIYDDILNLTWAQPDAIRTWDDANTWPAAWSGSAIWRAGTSAAEL